MTAPASMELDQAHIDAAAQYAAGRLRTEGVARVRLTPGDLTVYPLLIVAPGPELLQGRVSAGRNYWVALCSSFGAGYEWSGVPLEGGYATEKWTSTGSSNGTRRWTGEVVAQFLTAVSHAMRGPEAVRDADD